MTEYSFSQSDIYADMEAYNLVDLISKNSVAASMSKYYGGEYKKRVTKFTNNWSERKLKDLVYKYTKTKYLGVVKWPLLQHEFTNEQSEAARDAFVDYLIKERNKE